MSKRQASLDSLLNQTLKRTSTAKSESEKELNLAGEASELKRKSTQYLSKKKEENRSERIQFLLTPKLKKQLKQAKEIQGLSVNEIMHQILEKEIEKYL